MPGTPRRGSRRAHHSSASAYVNQSRQADAFVDTITTITSETRDSNDEHLIALARAHDVDAVVSGDEDLLDWDEQRPPVLTPAQFEERGGSTSLRTHGLCSNSSASRASMVWSCQGE